MSYEGPLEYTQAMALIAQRRSENLIPYLVLIGPGLFVGCRHETEKVYSICSANKQTHRSTQQDDAVFGHGEIPADGGELFSSGAADDD